MSELAGTRFEEAFKQLEATVRRLEEGDLSLDEAVALYEQGIVLARQCHTLLDQAELRVRKLTLSPQGDYEAEPLYPEDEDEEEA